MSTSYNFDLNIFGIEDVDQLNIAIPKLVRNIDKLDSEQKKMSTSSKSVSDRLAGLQLKVKKGDINNTRQLGREYGSIVSQIKRMGTESNKYNNLQLRAYNIHQRMRKEIAKQEEAQENLTGEVVKTGNAIETNNSKMRQGAAGGGMMRGASGGGMMRGRSAGAGLDKYSSYAMLNLGYLVQDAPYGIRGVGNNISQTVQAFQMLDKQVKVTNRTLGKNMTVFGAMKGLLGGPAGMIFMIGSVLPTALLLASEAWRVFKKDTKEAKSEQEEMKEEMSDFSAYSGASSSIDKILSSGITKSSFFGGLKDEQKRITEQERLESYLLKRVESLTKRIEEEEAAIAYANRVGERGESVLKNKGVIPLDKSFEEYVSQKEDYVDRLKRTNIVVSKDLDETSKAIEQATLQYNEISKLYKQGFFDDIFKKIKDNTTYTGFHFPRPEKVNIPSLFDGDEYSFANPPDKPPVSQYRLKYEQEVLTDAYQKEESIGTAERYLAGSIEAQKQYAEATIENEEQLKYEMLRIERQHQKKKEELYMADYNAKMQLAKMSVSASTDLLIGGMQAIGASSRAMFNTEKLAKASMAVINSEQAFTETIANGGFYATPLAWITRASGIAAAVRIMTQKYNSGASSSSGQNGGTLYSYRGYDISEPRETMYNSTYGGGEKNESQSNVTRFELVDGGSGKIITQGLMDNSRKNIKDNGYIVEP